MKKILTMSYSNSFENLEKWFQICFLFVLQFGNHFSVLFGNFDFVANFFWPLGKSGPTGTQLRTIFDIRFCDKYRVSCVEIGQHHGSESCSSSRARQAARADRGGLGLCQISHCISQKADGLFLLRSPRRTPAVRVGVGGAPAEAPDASSQYVKCR